MDDLCDSLEKLSVNKKRAVIFISRNGDNTGYWKSGGSDDDDSLQPLCNEMCPSKEVAFRMKNNLVHRLEQIGPGKGVKSSKNQFNRNEENKFCLVKEYKRSVFEEDLQNGRFIRPTSILRKTVDYLLGDDLKGRAMQYAPIDGKHFAWGEYYEFVFDRLRSVRQDLSVQRAVDTHATYILEKCVQFYIESSLTWRSFLAVQESVVGSYDAHINNEHLAETLSLLLSHYDSLTDLVWSLHRPLYESVHLIQGFGLLDENNAAQNRFRTLFLADNDKPLLENGLVQLARKMMTNSLWGNHFQVLRLLSSVGQKSFHPFQKNLFLSAFLVSSSLNWSHSMLLRSIVISCRGPSRGTVQIPISLLAQWLCPLHHDPIKTWRYLVQICDLLELHHQSPPKDMFNFASFNDDKIDSHKLAQTFLVLDSSIEVSKLQVLCLKMVRNLDLLASGWFSPLTSNL